MSVGYWGQQKKPNQTSINVKNGHFFFLKDHKKEEENS